MAWDEASTKIMIEMWNSGATASEIAARLGPPWTRNSCIAKAWRLRRAGQPMRGDLADRTKPSAQRKVKGKAKMRAERRVTLPLAKPKTRVALALEAVPFTPTPDPTTPTVFSVLNLVDSHCRWPYDAEHGGFHFCGRPHVPGLPYCGHHARVAFVEPHVVSHARPGAVVMKPELQDA